MSTIILIICIVICLAIISFITAEIIVDPAAPKTHFDSASQSILRSIRKEASKKNIDPDQMIIDALERVLADVKSL